MSVEKIKVRQGHVMILPDSQAAAKSGFVAEEVNPSHGTVVAMGPAKEYNDYASIPLSVMGARVMFKGYGYDEVMVDGVKHLVMDEENVICLFED